MKSRINRDEREISISELWWYVISKWKWLVIGLVVGALLMGAFGAYKAYSANNAETSKEITMENLTEEEQEEVKELIEDYEFYQAEVERLENNYLMNLDYNNLYRCLLTYYVDTDYSYNYMDVQEDYATELVSMYKTYVSGNEVRKRIMQLDIEGLEEIDLNYMISTSNEGHIVRVAVCAGEEDCVKIADVIGTAIEEYHSVAVNYVGTHKLAIISVDTIEVYSESIKNRQSTLTAYTKGLSDKITATQNTMSPSQVAVYEDIVSDETDTAGPATTSLFNKKYVVLGAIGGMAVAVVIFIVSFITGKKIKSVSELYQMYGMEVSGWILRDNVSGKYTIKKINKIDTDASETEQKKYVAEIILSKCIQNDIREVVFCSTICGLTEEISDVIKSLSNAGINSKCISNINCDTEALRVAVKSKNVIIVEQLNMTTRSNISSEIETCEKLAINILGMIAIV